MSGLAQGVEDDYKDAAEFHKERDAYSTFYIVEVLQDEGWEPSYDGDGVFTTSDVAVERMKEAQIKNQHLKYRVTTLVTLVRA